MIMKNDFSYDLLIIGGGISACVFASKYLQNNVKKIALIEAGRGLGGRSSTRISKRFKGWKLNHGAPNLNISKSNDNLLLKNYINELLEKKLIQIDDSELISLSDESKLKLIKKSEFYCGDSYLSSFTMSELSQKIIEFNNVRRKIDLFFETLIVDLMFNNDEWSLTSKNGEKFKSKYLICSTNLLMHKRSLKILNINQIPLRKAIPKNKDKKIDLLLNFLNKQSFIPRITFLIYTNNNYRYKDEYTKKYRYFYLNKDLENKYDIERVVFQLQKNKRLGIVVHSRRIDFLRGYKKDENDDIFKKKILIRFNNLFHSNTYINQLHGNEEISIMNWRASQPLGNGVPSDLQFCEKYKIGFCGDWFAEDGFGRIEGAILSALKLVNKIK